MAGTIGLKAIFTADDKMSPSIKKMAGAIRELNYAGEGLGKLDSFNGKIFDKLKTGAVAGATAIGLFAGVISKNVVESGADFEQSITNVGAVMGKHRDEIGKLEEQALSLGVTTQFSANEIAGGMEVMARKGFDADEILAGIPGTLNAVAASGEGTDEVIQVVASSLRGFGLAAKEATHVADVLSYVSEKTGAHITELGSALATAAPTANALGVSIEDTAAAVGLLQKMGIDAATSGSSVATMLAKISHPSKQAAEEMTAMGLKFQDAKGNMLPFRDVLGQFVKAGDKTTGNMKLMGFFAELVGLRGDKAALGLRRMAKSGEFDKLTEGLEHVDGQAQKVADIKLDTTKNQWKLLGSTIEVLEDKLFGLNGGALKETIERINAWVTANKDLIISGAQEYVGEIVTRITELSTHLDYGLMMLRNFKDGVVAAFEDSNTVKAFGFALSTVFGGPDDKNGPGIQAFLLGEKIGGLVFAFIGFEAIVKVTKGTVLAFEIGIKAIRGITILYEGTLALWKSTQLALNTATQIGMGNTIAFGGAMTAAGVGGGEMAAGVGSADAAMVGMEASEIGVAAAAVPAESGLAGIGLAAGAAVAPVIVLTAMLAALAAVAYNLYKLYQESGGASGMWAGIKGFHGVGTKSWGLNGYNEGVDSEANAKAKERRATEDAAAPSGAPPMPAPVGMPPAAEAAPGPYASGYVTPGMAPPPAPPPMIARAPAVTPEVLRAAVQQSIELTIRTPEGTSAEVTKKPPGTKVNLAASGAP